MTLKWIRGHVGTQGNEVADELAKEGSELPLVGPEPAVGVSPAWVRRTILNISSFKHDRLWREHRFCRQAKEFGIRREKKKAKRLLTLTRSQLRAIMCLLTGHGGFNKHLRRMGLAELDTCPSCGFDEDTASHLLCECDALHHKRLWSLGKSYLDTREVSTLSAVELLGFLRDTGRWQDITGN